MAALRESLRGDREARVGEVEDSFASKRGHLTRRPTEQRAGSVVRETERHANPRDEHGAGYQRSENAESCFVEGRRGVFLRHARHDLTDRRSRQHLAVLVVTHELLNVRGQQQRVPSVLFDAIVEQ